MAIFNIPEDQKNIENLTHLVRHINSIGQTPATSGNFSIRSKKDKNTIYVSESGVNKGSFKSDNLIPTDLRNGKVKDHDNQKKISYEAEIHFEIYNLIENANCVLHTHMLESLLVSTKIEAGTLEIQDLEILKAFPQINSHTQAIQIPIINNSQNISEICIEWGPYIKKLPTHVGFIIKNHGIYCWGKTLEDAQKHLEAFEYIFKILYFRSLKGF